MQPCLCTSHGICSSPERQRKRTPSFHARLLTTTKTENQMESALLLNVVVAQSATILQLLTSKDQTLLVRWNAFLVLDLRLDVINGIRGLHFQRNSLASQSLDKDLHTTTKTKDQVQSRFLLNIVVGKGAAVLELLASEDETLLVRWDTLLILDLRLYIVDGVRRFDLKSDGLSGKGLYDCAGISRCVRLGRRNENLQICMPPRRRRTRWRVDSFWML